MLVEMEEWREGPCYYSVLGVSSDCSIEEVKRAYRKLAMQWHPDRWTRKPSLLREAKRKFQQIQEAYSVLSDQRKRALYDIGLHESEDDEDEGFCDFVQEMLSLMEQERKKNKNYSMEELQKIFLEMAQGFESSPWYCGSTILDEHSRSKRAQYDANPVADTGVSHCSVSGWGIYGASSYCS